MRFCNLWLIFFEVVMKFRKALRNFLSLTQVVRILRTSDVQKISIDGVTYVRHDEEWPLKKSHPKKSGHGRLRVDLMRT